MAASREQSTQQKGIILGKSSIGFANMPTNQDKEDGEGGAKGISSSTVYSQPWWHGGGNSIIKDSHTQTGLNSNNNQEQLKHVASATPTTIREHLDANSQMELTGHSIVLASYPYHDAQYGGIMTYGAQVHPHLFGVHQARMALPLELEEEPVYVNAKQYHGILRRRQSRAKAESEKKVMKSRKPYLHESRHQHALKRARGCGGRFLKTKKLDSKDKKPPSGKKQKGGATLSPQSFNSSGSSDHISHELEGTSDLRENRHSMFRDQHKINTSSNGTINGHHVSYFTGREEGGGCCYDQGPR